MNNVMTRPGFGSPLLLWLGVSLSVAFGQSPAPRQQTSTFGVEKAVAIAAGERIYEWDLDAAAAAQLLPLRNQEYQIKSKALEELIRQRLVEREARKRGLTAAQLYAADVDSKIPTPGEAEVAIYYLALKPQIKTPLAEIRTQLQINLKALQTQQARQDYVDSLLARAEVTVSLRQPKVDVAFDRASLRGDAAAPVTIVEFADYQCPYCKQTETTLSALLKKYPGKVNVAFRDFPLESIHPYAEKASEAARCAGRQGKFWEYHDALFADQAKLEGSGLIAIAQQLSLDRQSFQSCLASGESKAEVSRDREDGRKAGISSTPGFFVNGIFLSGAQPEAAFEKLIEDELRTARN